MDAVDFLRKDYELKVNYLSGHLSRMWTRFNFFLSIESALLAFSFNKDNAPHAPFLAAAGLMVSLLWYRFAATDNYLVEVYRRQVAHVFSLLRSAREAAFVEAGLDPTPEGYTYVGEVSQRAYNRASGAIEPIEQNLWQSRREGMSATELGVVFALLFVLLWIGRFVIWWVQS